MKKNILVSILLLGTLMLSACGSNKDDEAKARYRDSLQQYYDQIYMTSISINSIDASVSGADAQLLGYIDTMSDSFLGLTTIETPERYAPLQTLTTQAATYFGDAARIYHEIYSVDGYGAFDENKAEEAFSYYSQAMNILAQIGQSLMADEEANGNVPETTDEIVNEETTLQDVTVDFSSGDTATDNEEDYYEEDEDYVIVDEDYESDNFGMGE